MKTFEDEVADRVANARSQADMCEDAARFMRSSILPGYSYNFS